ncbi:uncharacterized protein LOC124673096 [Lolium rigidum]|uniref:uncharacterized protein LOC124673096 n=1 Tax=Lolium rigidum TaxID=89674 RepID=UPI001F5C73F3|nr:uncharacterized protein LOC124673096 [Lolium rigidum]
MLFYHLCENILDYNNDVQLGLIAKAFIGAASASKGKRLELSDRLFFPICRSRHWFTFSVDFKFRLFVFLDSLYNKDDDFHTSIKNVLINNFVRLWQIIFKTEENIFKNFSVMYAKVPKQANADDCGVFTMKFMEIFKPEVDTCSLFSKEDIIHIRIQFANQIYFCKRNNVDKSVVVNYKIQWQNDYSQENIFFSSSVFDRLRQGTSSAAASLLKWQKDYSQENKKKEVKMPRS